MSKSKTKGGHVVYQCFTTRSVWQCEHARRGKPCTSPNKCHNLYGVAVMPSGEGPFIEKRQSNVIRGWGDGTNGNIVLAHDEAGCVLGLRTRSRERAVAWLARRLSNDADFRAEEMVSVAENRFAHRVWRESNEERRRGWAREVGYDYDEALACGHVLSPQTEPDLTMAILQQMATS